MKTFLLVSGILAIAVILFLLSPIYRAIGENRKYDLAKRQVAGLKQAVLIYRNDNNGITPSNGSLSQFASYAGGIIPEDPWGHDYVYLCPGAVNTTGYDVICYGVDGVAGGEGINKDIIMGEEGTLGVKLTKLVKVVCPNCGHKLSEKQETVTLSYLNAKQYQKPNGQYQVLVSSESDSVVCEACQEKIDAKTKMPYLIGKSRQQVLDIMDSPTSDFNMLGGAFSSQLEWRYEDKPKYYLTTVIFYDSGLVADYVQMVYWGAGWGSPDHHTKVIDLLPNKLLTKEPDQIHINPGDNYALVLGWALKGGRYVASIYSSLPLVIETKKMNISTGSLESSYSLSGISWRDCLVRGISQCGPRHKVGNGTNNGLIRLK